MMFDELRQIIPLPQPEIEETFAAYQATRQFYQEVQSASMKATVIVVALERNPSQIRVPHINQEQACHSRISVSF